MALKLYLARHGETEENVAGILQGHLPGHLTARGRQQACDLREKLRYLPIDHIVCSDLQRCIDTASIVNEAFHLPLHSTVLLRERDWGKFTGHQIRTGIKDIDLYAESADAMFTRAELFLKMLTERYDGRTVLAIGHGLFDRVIQGAYYGKSIREIPRMENAEVRVLDIITPLCFHYLAEESGASAD